MDCFRRKFVSDGSFFFTLIQYWTQLWEVKGQIFAKLTIFQIYIEISIKKLQSSDMKLSPAYSSFIFVQMKCLYRLLMEYVWRITFRKWTASPSPAISPEGKLGQWPWLTWGSVNRDYKHVYVKISHGFALRTSRNPQKRQISHYRSCMGSAKVSDLGWPLKGQDAMS